MRKSVRRLLTIVASFTLMLTMSMQTFAAETKETNSDALIAEVVSTEEQNASNFDEVKQLMGLPTLTYMTAREEGETYKDPLGIVARAGNETWTGSGFGGAFRFTDYNLTPVKTMGQSGLLAITGYFYGDDGYADSVPIKLTFQIRDTSGRVLATTVVEDTRNGNIPFVISCSVSQGQKIQLFMDASSIGNPPGPTRSAYIAYDYAILN